ncbi:MAG: hypothetical protein JNL66_06955 [Alphaproteobacteria bacterium]|nr:hypothetical protein [Alphaproteobacteria bacterium]
MGQHGGRGPRIALRSRPAVRSSDQPAPPARDPAAAGCPHARAAAVPPGGFRHLLGDAPAARFTLFGKPVDAVPAAEVMAVMGKLARRMQVPFAWTAPLAPGLKPDDNPDIPSGFTYLLQLVTHDLVASSIPATLTNDLGTLFNGRFPRALRLETVYGGGPGLCPFVYRIDAAVKADPSDHPRTQFRLGAIRNQQGELDPTRLRDVARAAVGASNDDPTAEQPIADGSTARPVPTEALVADQRNDDHAIISQLTTLFCLLHNGIVDRLAALPPVAGVAREEAAHDRFACARQAVEAIYRRIVVGDVLPRLLDPLVRTRFEAGFRLGPAGDARMALEFSHGAFRFGHAMVREGYRINDAAAPEIPIAEGLRQSSIHFPTATPVSDRWVVNWSFFFDPKNPRRNLSRRLAPHFVNALSHERLFGPVHPDRSQFGVAFRDMMSAAACGLWSVPALIAALRTRPEFASLLPADFADWQAKIAAWLPCELGPAFEPAEIATLSAEPPLPFFVLFEAALDGAAQGRRLGPLGSIIVADTLYGALDGARAAGEDPDAPLAETLRAIAARTHGAETALAFIPEIDSMLALIRFMGTAFGLDAQKPAFSRPPAGRFGRQ